MQRLALSLPVLVLPAFFCMTVQRALSLKRADWTNAQSSSWQSIMNFRRKAPSALGTEQSKAVSVSLPSTPATGVGSRPSTASRGQTPMLTTGARPLIQQVRAQNFQR